VAGQDRTLAETFKVWGDALLEEIHKACPAKVTAYDPLTNTIVAKPVVKRPVATTDGVDYEDLPEIPFVTVQWPRAGGYVLTCPITPGDTVLLVFTDFSLAEWRATGEVSEPADVRRHSAGWPVAIPGVYADIAPLDPLDIVARTTGMIIGRDGQPEQIRIQPGLIQIGHTPFGAPIEISAAGIKLGGILALDAVALATPTNAGLAAVQAAIVAICGYLASLQAALNSHVHTGVTAGAASSGAPGTPFAGVPSAPSAPATVAATLVKAV
jgi:hypothetical protein